jgi:hypothetical protein
MATAPPTSNLEHMAKILIRDHGGGTDLIAKPRLYTELALKALILVLAAKFARER